MALVDVEGSIPKDLNGTLYRVSPGEKTSHGVELLWSNEKDDARTGAHHVMVLFARVGDGQAQV